MRAGLMAAVVMMWAGAGPAEEAAPIPPGVFDTTGLTSSLPEATLKRLRTAPAKLVEDMTALILGFGDGERIDAAGIERFIAAERARSRAREIERLLQADLDDDGAVSRAEAAVVIATQSAGARARLHLAQRAADADGDGSADRDEITAAARARSLEDLSEADAENIRAAIWFDLDGDGYVTLAEVIAAVKEMQIRT